MHRRFIALLAAPVGVIAISATALAGGWAQIQTDQAAFDPRAGAPTEFGFTVLQHGQTPVSWVHPAVVVTDLEASSSRTYTATQSGPEGHFVATITIDGPGLYTWEVTMPDLVVEGSPATFVALNPDGSAPQIKPAVLVDLALAAVDARLAGGISSAPTTGVAGPTKTEPTKTEPTKTEPTKTEPTATRTSADSPRVDALAADVAGLQGEITLLRMVLVGLAAAVAAMLAGGAAMAWSRRRAAVSSESPSPEAAFGR